MKSITEIINENAISMKQDPKIMKTHSWELIGPGRYANHFRCVRCGAEGIHNKSELEVPRTGSFTTPGEKPEFYDNSTYHKLTCNEILIKNILT